MRLHNLEIVFKRSPWYVRYFRRGSDRLVWWCCLGWLYWFVDITWYRRQV